MQSMREKKNKVVIGPEKHRPVNSAIYRAKLLQMRLGIGAFDQPAYLLSWEILDESLYKDRIISDFVNKNSNGLRGKLWQLRRALTNDELDIFDSFFMEDLLGKECFIDVEKRGGFNAVSRYICPKDLEGVKRLRFPA